MHPCCFWAQLDFVIFSALMSPFFCSYINLCIRQPLQGIWPVYWLPYYVWAQLDSAIFRPIFGLLFCSCWLYSLASWLAAAALVPATGLPYSPCQLHIQYLYIYILGRVCRVHGQ